MPSPPPPSPPLEPALPTDGSIGGGGEIEDDEISGPTLTSLESRYRRHRLKLVVFIVVTVVLTVLFIIYDKTIMDALRPWKTFLNDAGVGGHAIIAALVFVCSFPPVFGYSSIVIFSGYVFGLLGFVSCFVGAALGSVVCYPLFRSIGRKWMLSAQQGDPRLRAAVSAVERGGFKMVLWIRLTPLSFCIVNAVLPSIPTLMFTPYFIATVISLPKLLVHVFIGTRFATLGDEQDLRSRLVNYAYLALTGLLGFGLCYYIYRLAWRKVEGSNSERSMADAETTIEPHPLHPIPNHLPGAEDFPSPSYDTPPSPESQLSLTLHAYSSPASCVANGNGIP